MTVEEEIANRLIRELRDGGDEDFDTTTDSNHDIRAAIDALAESVIVMGYHGTQYYVDQDVGTDSASTTGAEDDPWATQDYAFGRVTPNNGDIIIVLPSTSTYDNNVNVGGILADQAGTAMVMPMNRLVDMVNSNAAATAVITVSAGNITIVGGFISETTNTVEGVVINTADDVHVYDMQLDGAMENGIVIISGHRDRIKGCYFRDMTNDGIELTVSCTDNRITDNVMYTPANYGIHLNGANVDDNWVLRNKIYKPGLAQCVRIALGDNNQILDNHFTAIPGTTFPIFDSGDTNQWEDNRTTPAGSSFNREVADGVGEVTEIDDLDLPSSGRYTVKLDVDALDVAGEGGTITARLLGKTDDTNYTIEDLSTFDVPGADEVMPAVSSVFEGGAARLRVTFQTSIATTANRIVYWKVIKE